MGVASRQPPVARHFGADMKITLEFESEEEFYKFMTTGKRIVPESLGEADPFLDQDAQGCAWFSYRVRNCCRRNPEIQTLRHLLLMGKEKALDMRNFGDTAARQVAAFFMDSGYLWTDLSVTEPVKVDKSS